MTRPFRPQEARQPAKQADQRDGVNDALHLDCVGVGVQAWQPEGDIAHCETVETGPAWFDG